MIDIDRFYELLNEVCDELPDEFFRELHHGVILSEDKKISPHAVNEDLLVLGDYTRSSTGNKIIIYYGSFAVRFPNADEDAIRKQLREVVRHEFRHHMENLSGMYGADSLEREDEIWIRDHIRRRKSR